MARFQGGFGSDSSGGDSSGGETGGGGNVGGEAGGNVGGDSSGDSSGSDFAGGNGPGGGDTGGTGDDDEEDDSAVCHSLVPSVWAGSVHAAQRSSWIPPFFWIFWTTLSHTRSLLPGVRPTTAPGIRR